MALDNHIIQTYDEAHGIGGFKVIECVSLKILIAIIYTLRACIANDVNFR